MAQITLSMVPPPIVPTSFSEYKSYDVAVPVYEVSQSGRKILYVVDHPTFDEIEKGELSGGSMSSTLEQLTEHCEGIVKKDLAGFCIRNFYLFDFNKKATSSYEQQKINELCWGKLKIFISKYKPDCVVFFGFDIADCAWPNEDNLKYLGRIRKFKFSTKSGSHTFNGIVSLSIFDMVNTPENIKRKYGRPAEKEEVGKIIKHSCLLGFIAEHIQTAIRGKSKYDLRNLPYRSVMIKTIEDFRIFMKDLHKASTPCFDTETVSLARRHNRVLTVQVTLDGKTGYLIPIDHKDTIFTASELKEIKKAFKHYFEFGKSKWVIFHNSKFDVTQFMGQFEVRYFTHRIYDTMLGEYALDENLVVMNKSYTYHGKKLKPYSLETISYKYGSHLYDTGAVAKDTRNNMEKYSLEELTEYGVKDVIIPFHISRCQIAEAEYRGHDSYILTVVDLLGSITKTMIRMEYSGIPVDRKYLMMMKGRDSYFNKKIRDIEEAFKNSPAVLKTNSILIKKFGMVEGSLFKGVKNFIFDISKKVHKNTLFFDVLRLAPLKIGKDGYGSTGKVFKLHYGKDVPEVALLNELGGALKLRDTYVTKFADRLLTDPDAKKDSCFRGSYSIIEVVTGRASSIGGLHQIPQHSKDAKHIKRNFVAGMGYIFIKTDFSAHEVRKWANIAKDLVLAGNFSIGLEYRRKRRLDVTPEELKEIDAILKVKGDLHRLNYQHFFGVPADQVTDTQRQNIKKVVFGVIYGKMAKGLAEELGISEEEAQELIDKLFSTLAQGAAWLKDTISTAREEKTVHYVLGQIRHLWGYFNSSEAIKRAMDRRGPNSSIQGTSSHLAFLSGFLAEEMFWNMCVKNNLPVDCRQCNGVHDSEENIGKIVQAPFLTYIIEHSMTTQLAKLCADKFNFEFLIDTEVEFAFGCSLSSLDKWGFRDDEFIGIIERSIDWGNAEMQYNLNKKETMKKVKHNLNIISKFRKKEIATALKRKGKVAKEMLITPDNIAKLGLVWD